MAMRGISYLFISAALGTRAIADSGVDWKPVLSVLNQTPGARAQLLATDLTQAYEKELKTITAQWERTGKHGRAQRNHFFHARIVALNEQTLAQLEKSPAGHGHYREIAQRVLKKVQANPVASIAKVPSFDPSGEVGFCFGRAMLVHYWLLKEGVSPSDLEKVFVLGELMVEGQFWNFHTAILLRDAEGGVLVVDPLEAHPLPLREWTRINAAREVKGRFSRARFYVTDPRKFLPAEGEYSAKVLEAPHLKAYFAALRKTLPSPGGK
jgi:hypothetical protein